MKLQNFSFKFAFVWAVKGMWEGGMELYFRLFLASESDEWSASGSSRFTPGNFISLHPLNGKLNDLQSQYWNYEYR
jgi:hypothetical protein